jgi:hypothetical protein
MMNKILMLVCLMSMVQFDACWSTPEHTQLICIVDVTASIDPVAQAEAMTALQTALRQLQRGDSLVVIPVTSDAATPSAGRVLRFRLSEKRAAYDADRQTLATEAMEKLKALQQEAQAHPPQHSDILGALQQAAEEMAQAKGKIVIVVLSDLVQDTPSLHFRSDPHLQNEAAAVPFAAHLTQQKTLHWQGKRVFVGLLRSRDWQGLAEPRRAALRTFWTEFFKRGGASEVTVVTDGPGLLPQFLARDTATK